MYIPYDGFRENAIQHVHELLEVLGYVLQDKAPQYCWYFNHPNGDVVQLYFGKNNIRFTYHQHID